MAAALIGSINKEEVIKIRVDIPESLHDELKIYSCYVGGTEGDIPEVINKIIIYVLDRESKGTQGKKYKEFKQQYLREYRNNMQEKIIENQEE